MLITYIKLVKYKRFPLSDIEVFEKDISSKLTAIIGCNGSGKSSLLKELSPLPSSKDNFYSGGYKEIVVQHKGSEYRLISDFTSTPKYSFLHDEVELNPASLVTIQKELVEQHFNITEEVYDLLIGLSTFSTLTVPQRKKLFNNISKINIDELLELFNNHREDLKVQESLLKTQISLYNAENEKLVNKSQIDKLYNERNSISEYVNTLTEIRAYLKHYSLEDSNYPYSEFKSIIDRYNNFIQSKRSLFTSYPSSSEDLRASIANRLNNTTVRLNTLYSELDKLLKNKQSIDLSRSTSLLELENKKKSIEQSIANLSKDIKFFSIESDTNQLFKSLHVAESSVLSFIYEVESNEDKKYSKEKHELLLKDKQSTLREIELINVEESKLIANKEIISGQSLKIDVKCPSCRTTFTPDYSRSLLDTFSTRLEAIDKHRTKLKLELAKIEESIAKSTNYFNYNSTYGTIKRSNPLLDTVWNYISSEEYYLSDPRKIPTILKNAILETNNIKSIQDYKQELTKLISTIDTLKLTDRANLDNINNSIADIDSEISELQHIKHELNSTLTKLKYTEKFYLELESIKDTINSTQTLVYNQNLSTASNCIINQIDAELAIHKLNLISIETQINSFNKTSSILAQYTSDIATTRDNILVLKDIIDAMSPKTGLIAKILSSYLNAIIRFMNTTIKSVMDYDFYIQDIDTDENTLDYKFRFRVDGKLLVTDIAKASSGMREIVDLSFKLAFYKLLKLDNYPLYLDEFGVRLDASHKSKIHNLIFKFINSSNFSQIFLVTHTDTGFLNYKDTEVIQL